jgi:hypothetical protein
MLLLLYHIASTRKRVSGELARRSSGFHISPHCPPVMEKHAQVWELVCHRQVCSCKLQRYPPTCCPDWAELVIEHHPLRLLDVHCECVRAAKGVQCV